ncbi:MAG: type II toxin-antitoxin system RelE/ParE family toxin [Patescibacteria group bacterium]
MEIIHYHPDIEKFFSSLESTTATKVARLIELLGIREYNLVMPFSRMLEKGLYELRIQGMSNVRVFYTFYGGKVFLLHAVSKKTKKLERRDLKTARGRLVLLRKI